MNERDNFLELIGKVSWIFIGKSDIMNDSGKNILVGYMTYGKWEIVWEDF